jgi:hypothetical protein
MIKMPIPDHTVSIQPLVYLEGELVDDGGADAAEKRAGPVDPLVGQVARDNGGAQAPRRVHARACQIRKFQPPAKEHIKLILEGKVTCHKKCTLQKRFWGESYLELFLFFFVTFPCKDDM